MQRMRHYAVKRNQKTINRVLFGFMAMVLCITATAAAADEVLMSDEVEGLLGELLNEERMETLHETLGSRGWGSLGPMPTGAPEPLGVEAPERVIELEIPQDAEGSGTPEDPYVISDFLNQFQFEPHDIPNTPRPRRHPDRGMAPLLDSSRMERQTQNYIGGLDYDPTTIVIPAGHYLESSRGSEDNTAVVVPPSVWLVSEGEVVIEPEVERGDGEVVEEREVDVYQVRKTVSNTFFKLNPRSGLVNLTLDGRRTDDFEPGPLAPFEGPMPATRVTAVQAAPQSVIADCHLIGFTHQGIGGGRATWQTTLINNVIEQIGHSGVSAGSEWLIRDNRIRQAGLYRAGRHNDGDDGIIIRHGEKTQVINNLIVQKRDPGSRHLFSGQCCDFNLYAGNIGIVEHESRNIYGIDDGSHFNRLIGNVALSTGGEYESDDPLVKNFIGFWILGVGNLVDRNFAIGTHWSYCTMGRSGATRNIITDNYGEYVIAPIHHRWTRNYVKEGNTFSAYGKWPGAGFDDYLPSVLPLAIENDPFNLFVPAAAGKRAVEMEFLQTN